MQALTHPLRDRIINVGDIVKVAQLSPNLRRDARPPLLIMQELESADASPSPLRTPYSPHCPHSAFTSIYVHMSRLTGDANVSCSNNVSSMYRCILTFSPGSEGTAIGSSTLTCSSARSEVGAYHVDGELAALVFHHGRGPPLGQAFTAAKVSAPNFFVFSLARASPLTQQPTSGCTP